MKILGIQKRIIWKYIQNEPQKISKKEEEEGLNYCGCWVKGGYNVKLVRKSDLNHSTYGNIHGWLQSTGGKGDDWVI